MECQGLFSLNCSVLPISSRPNRTMTSADFWWFSYLSPSRLWRVLHVSIRPPRVSTCTFTPSIRLIYLIWPSTEGTLFCSANLSNHT